MAKYIYHYLDGDGRRRLAWTQAANEAVCCAQLAARNIYPIFVLRLQLPGVSERRQSSRELAVFFRQLAVALASGVPLLEALRYMADEQNGARQRAFVMRLEEGVLAGLSFSQALAREKGVTPMLSQWIAIGERQGRLAAMLEEVYHHLEEKERLKKRIQQQLLYPFMVLAAVLVVGGFLSVVVMPVLAVQFLDVEADLPVIMRVFLLLHDVLRDSGGVLLLLIVALVMVVFYLRKSSNARWRQLCKRGMLRLPLLRQFALLQVFVPFSRLFGQMLRSGVSVGDALQELQRYFARTMFADDVAAIAAAMTHGSSLSQTLAKAPFVPALACQMLRNGERYGRLPEALCDAAAYYETILFEKMGLWLRFMEPLAVVLLGLLVLLMALGLFVPVLESYQSLLVT